MRTIQAGNSEEPAEPQILQTKLGRIECATFGQGPAILALHGAMGGWDQSQLLAKTIGEPGYRYLAVSRPGYLGTPISTGRAPEKQADLYAAVLDELGETDAIAMAVSGGGPSAIHFALRHRDRCRGLVLVSTCGTTVEGRPPLAFHIAMLLARLPGFERMARRKAELDLGEAASASIPDAELRERTLKDPVVGPLFRELILSTSCRISRRIAGTKNDIKVAETCEYPLERIEVPVLVVHGTDDRMVPFERHGRALASRIPGAELLALRGGDHVSIYTHNREVRAKVSSFLRDHRPTGTGQRPSAPQT